MEEDDMLTLAMEEARSKIGIKDSMGLPSKSKRRGHAILIRCRDWGVGGSPTG